MTGNVFDIQKFSLHDGPGIRTAIFLKGCPLRCIWCHNPESRSGKKEILFSAEKCVKCGKCVLLCPHQCHTVNEKEHRFKRENCTGCGLCTKQCYTEALTLCGKEMSVEAVIKEVLKDRIFYENSGGGITLSGGEPMTQFSFTKELLAWAKKENLHTAMETCGFAPQENYAKILALTDLFLFDIKSMDEAKHIKFTGKSNTLILENLRFLDENGAKIRLRCPLIPTLNDSEEELIKIAELANTLKNVEAIDVEPYHPLGVSKAAQLGDQEYFHAPFTEKEQWEKWIAILKDHTGIQVKKE